MPSAVTANPCLVSVGGWSYPAWGRQGLGVCRLEEQHFEQSLPKASRCLRGSSGLWHQWGWRDPLPVLYKFSPVLISQTFFSQGSFVFPPSYTRLFPCLCGHLPCRGESWVVFVAGASWNHSTRWGFPMPLPPCSCFRLIWHDIFQLTILTAIWI